VLLSDALRALYGTRRSGVFRRAVDVRRAGRYLHRRG
jgi:hypothetical protein